MEVGSLGELDCHKMHTDRADSHTCESPGSKGVGGAPLSKAPFFAKALVVVLEFPESWLVLSHWEVDVGGRTSFVVFFNHNKTSPK